MVARQVDSRGMSRHARVVVITDRDERRLPDYRALPLTVKMRSRNARSGRESSAPLRAEDPCSSPRSHKFGAGTRNGRDAKPGELSIERSLPNYVQQPNSGFRAKGISMS